MNATPVITRRYLVYDPPAGQWLQSDAGAGQRVWTTNHREAQEFPTFQAADTARNAIERERGHHGLYVTERLKGDEYTE